MIIEILLAIIAILLAILIFLVYRIIKNREMVSTVTISPSTDSMVNLYTKMDELSKDIRNQTSGMSDTVNYPAQ